LPLSSRIPNVLVSYVAYLCKMVWPTNLAVYYPYRNHIPLSHTIAAALILCGITFLVVRAVRHGQLYLGVGWFWYLGALVPVIGFLQVGLQAMADRYSYVPLIGIFIIVAWGVPDLLGGWKWKR